VDGKRFHKRRGQGQPETVACQVVFFSLSLASFLRPPSYPSAVAIAGDAFDTFAIAAKGSIVIRVRRTT